MDSAKFFAAPKHGSTLGLANISKKKAWSWLALSIAYRSGESELRKILFEIWGYPDYERNFTKFGGLLRNARELLNCAQIFTCDARAY